MENNTCVCKENEMERECNFESDVKKVVVNSGSGGTTVVNFKVPCCGQGGGTEEGIPGRDGESAYEIAVRNGFVGTEQEWLDSLHGMNGSGANIGEIFWWPKIVPPEDSLYCNGREISRIDYKDLFEVIGTQFGTGDGSTTFNLPNLCGEFIRGYDPEKINDPEGDTREFGSEQRDAVQRFSGRFNSFPWLGPNPSSGTSGVFKIETVSDSVPNTTSIATGNNSRYGFINIDSSLQIRSSTETRPTNVNLMPCIRYKEHKS